MIVSKGEATFRLHCKAYGLTPETEFRFHPGRKWALDFAWPDQKVGVEIEGGTRLGGRHNRHDGFEADAEKYNEAAIMGWLILRFTTDMVEKGTAIDTVLRVIRPCQTQK
jgi:very-short-patch-repair endonuclease